MNKPIINSRRQKATPSTYPSPQRSNSIQTFFDDEDAKKELLGYDYPDLENFYQKNRRLMGVYTPKKKKHPNLSQRELQRKMGQLQRRAGGDKTDDTWLFDLDDDELDSFFEDEMVKLRAGYPTSASPSIGKSRSSTPKQSRPPTPVQSRSPVSFRSPCLTPCPSHCPTPVQSTSPSNITDVSSRKCYLPYPLMFNEESQKNEFSGNTGTRPLQSSYLETSDSFFVSSQRICNKDSVQQCIQALPKKTQRILLMQLHSMQQTFSPYQEPFPSCPVTTFQQRVDQDDPTSTSLQQAVSGGPTSTCLQQVVPGQTSTFRQQAVPLDPIPIFPQQTTFHESLREAQFPGSNTTFGCSQYSPVPPEANPMQNANSSVPVNTKLPYTPQEITSLPDTTTVSSNCPQSELQNSKDPEQNGCLGQPDVTSTANDRDYLASSTSASDDVPSSSTSPSTPEITIFKIMESIINDSSDGKEECRTLETDKPRSVPDPEQLATHLLEPISEQLGPLSQATLSRVPSDKIQTLETALNLLFKKMSKSSKYPEGKTDNSRWKTTARKKLFDVILSALYASSLKEARERTKNEITFQSREAEHCSLSGRHFNDVVRNSQPSPLISLRENLSYRKIFIESTATMKIIREESGYVFGFPPSGSYSSAFQPYKRDATFKSRSTESTSNTTKRRRSTFLSCHKSSFSNIKFRPTSTVLTRAPECLGEQRQCLLPSSSLSIQS